MYGSSVRFYSTVVDWDYIHTMREDLIERMTSKLFENDVFTNMILQLCGELTRKEEEKYVKIKRDFANMKPKDLGISPFFTLDDTSKLESVFLQLHPEQHIGDSGSSTPTRKKTAGYPASAPNDSLRLNQLSVLPAIPEEVHRMSFDNGNHLSDAELLQDDDSDDEQAFENIME